MALNLAEGHAGCGSGSGGSAILVWNAETGECLYTKSKNWELNTELRLVGFGPYSEDIQVTESSYWSLTEKRPYSYVATDWHLPNPRGEAWNEAPLLRNDVPFVKVVAPPGDWPKTSGSPTRQGHAPTKGPRSNNLIESMGGGA